MNNKKSPSYVYYAILPAIVFGAMATEVFKNPENVPAGILVAFIASLFAIVPALGGAAREAFKEWIDSFPSNEPVYNIARTKLTT